LFVCIRIVVGDPVIKEGRLGITETTQS